MSQVINHSIREILKYSSRNILLESSIKPGVTQHTREAIASLKETAFHYRVVSLSANQVGLEERVFVCLKNEYIKPGQWKYYESLVSSQQYQAIINPIEISSSFENICAYEECPTFETLKFQVWAPILLNVQYYSEEDFARKKYIQLQGFKCRVWDHQIRHLEGLLPIEQNICKSQFFLLDEYKSNAQEIEQYEKLKLTSEMFQEKNLKKMRREMIREKMHNKSNPHNIDQLVKENLNAGGKKTNFMHHGNKSTKQAVKYRSERQKKNKKTKK